MSSNKPYFHELPQEQVDKLLEEGKTWNDIMEAFSQPEWCTYHQALSGQMGCWSLVDLSEGGFRTKISTDYCKNCDCFKEKSPA